MIRFLECITNAGVNGRLRAGQAQGDPHRQVPRLRQALLRPVQVIQNIEAYLFYDPSSSVCGFVSYPTHFHAPFRALVFILLRKTVEPSIICTLFNQF